LTPSVTLTEAPVDESEAVAEISQVVSFGTGGQLKPWHKEKPAATVSPMHFGADTVTAFWLLEESPDAVPYAGVVTGTEVVVVGAGRKLAEVLMNFSSACSAANSIVFSDCCAATTRVLTIFELIIDKANKVITTKRISVTKSAAPRSNLYGIPELFMMAATCG